MTEPKKLLDLESRALQEYFSFRELADGRQVRNKETNKWQFAAGDRDELDRLARAWEDLRVRAREAVESIEINAQADVVRAKYSPTPETTRMSNDPSTDAALRTLEGAHKRGEVHDAGAAYVDALVRTGSTSARRTAADWVTAAADPAYLRAFSKVLSDPTRGHMSFTGPEAEAFQRVSALDLESRTALGTGGMVLPVSVDPVVMLTNAGAISGIADAARRVSVPFGDAWHGITSAGATHEWKVENAEAADGTPAMAEVEVPLFSSVCNVTWSYEVQDAAAGELGSELRRVVADAVAVAWAAAFATGDGATGPAGLITGLAGTASEINGLGSEVLAKTDPYALQAALGARFSKDARWLSHIATANAYRQFETTNGAHEFPELRNSPPMLLGKPWFEESSMDSSINAAATANNYMLVYGDIARAFVIATQPGSRVQVLPAYGTNGRPTAANNLLVYSRVGSKVVNVNAARLLDIPTTA